jgi:hypothetical protein
MDRDELDKMSSEELHDRALGVATKRLDVGFLWTLVKAIPAAQAAAGHDDEAAADVASLTTLITDSMHAGGGELGDALRPLYIDYLEQHG